MDTAIGAKTLDHPFWETLLLAGLYGLAYMGLFLLSDKIIGLAGFSLWFPAAGIRFALIFVYGWRFGLLAASVEILAQGLLGEWTSWHYDPVFIVAGIGAPPLIYAAVIWVLNRYQLTHAAFSKFSHVIWICIAVVLAPALTAPVSTGLQVYGHRMAAGAFQEATLSFWVGDMVGLLMIAPIAMLSIAAFREKTTKFFKNVQNFVFLLEYAAALLFIWMTFQYTQGTLPSLRWLPLVLPMLAISLRFGFAGAGLIILSLNIMVLGIAVELRSDARFELQIFLALLSLMGLLLGGLVTARARAKKQLANQFKTIAHLDRMNTMGELATHIIHELAQPINTTSLYASGAIRMLEAGKLDQEELLNVLSLTAVETTRMQELIRRMKAFAKNGELVREETTAQAIIEGVGHMIDMAAKQAHVSVSYCLPKEKLPLTVDNIQIQQAVLNLVRNSIEAMETGERKELTIRASRIDDRNICISITDTGPGMPNDLVLGTTTKPGGMGVGLRIVDAIVNAHFGTLHINQNTISLILKI